MNIVFTNINHITKKLIEAWVMKRKIFELKALKTPLNISSNL